MSDENPGIELSKEQVCKAVEALRALIKQKENVKNLLDESEKVNLQFCFKKIPNTKNATIKIKLPNPLTQATTDVCLFAKDLNKASRDYEPTVRHFKELLNKHGVKCVTEVIPLKSLKLEYKPFEAKRNLSNMYDLYLADERIVRLLPSFLGKNFYGRKRNPIPVNLQAKDLKKEISEAVDNSRCYITGKGSSCMVTIAHTGMTTDEIVENILASVNQLSVGIPGGPDNIKLFVIKTIASASVPLYASVGSPADIQVSKVRPSKVKHSSEPQEITTLFGAKVKVTSHGKVFIIKDGSSVQTKGERSHFREKTFQRAMIKSGSGNKKKTEHNKFHRPLMNSGKEKKTQKQLFKKGKKETKTKLAKSTVKTPKMSSASSKVTVVKTSSTKPATKKRRLEKL
ncbi:ribosomal L1 domain-containing protein 1-like [Gigantopelta aegis]|uniref:ribosomal L1 domain-containing protein 1-like n=1 Tax=Gigantopelta aegis TaxID=1735272 RepID=UPI001B88774C|nr:ribosomal L1 domain-containing protein 1-like [Gigantopelta aegis]